MSLEENHYFTDVSIISIKGSACQRGYGIGGFLKGLTRTFAPAVKKGLLNVGKQALQSEVQVLDDVSRGEDVKMAIKRRTIEGAKKSFCFCQFS